MPLRHLLVTPLPDGRTPTTLRLSVLLSPRLREEGVLADYPEWADWGRFVTAPAAPLAFRVIIDGVQAPPANVAVTSAPVDPQVWRAVFGDPPIDVGVEPASFVDRSATELVAMDSAATVASIEALAAGVAGLRADETTTSVVAALAADAVERLPAAQRFFGFVGTGTDPDAPSQEFHALLAFLLAHPALVRALGLAFDLEVTVPVGLVPGEVAVRTNWVQKIAGPAQSDEVNMRVAVDTDFRPVVLDTAYRDARWLTLGASKYAVSQLDLAYSTNQLGHLADAVAAEPDPPTVIEVPALLESGLSVIHVDLDDVLTTSFARQRTVEDGIDRAITLGALAPVLFAEDITMGQRYDVVDVTLGAPYRSLHDRQVPGGYEFPEEPGLVLVPPNDEGWSSVALSTDGGVDTPTLGTVVRYRQEGGPQILKSERRDDTPWRVNDHIVTWAGWSLSTPKPGRSTNSAGEVVPGSATAPTATSAAQVSAAYEHVNQTLPKLRYGHDYQFRARCVDLVGHSEPLGAVAPPDAESATIRFGRLTPLSPPVVLRRTSRPDPGVGDQTDVLVITSELRQSDASTAPTERLLFPPRTSQVVVERHDLPAGGNDPLSYDLLVARDARSLEDQTIVDPETGELVAGAALVGDVVTPGPTIATVEYLADPPVRRIALTGLPNAVQPTTLLDVGAWPAVRTWNLQLRAGSAAPQISNAQRRITVRLPKGTVHTFELSSAPDAAFLTHFAAAQDISDADAALDGLLPSISPSRMITLVHAVRLPLRPPGFGTTTATRSEFGQTDMVVDLVASLHRPTTDRLLVTGRWAIPVDDPSEAGPVDVVGRAVIADLTVPIDGDAATAEFLGLRYDLGDTRRRLVRLESDAFCRFSKYFTERLDGVIDSANGVDLDARGVASGTVTLSDRTTGSTFRNSVDFDVDGASGRLTVLDPTVLPAATSIRAEFVPLPVSRPSSQSPVPVRSAIVDVPASSAPAAPVVAAVLPAFHRTISTTPNRIRVVHDGRVVRVHLRRPWYSSGSGEVLGVAIDPAGVVEPTLTEWARDPLVGGPGTDDRPSLAHFTRATALVTQVDGRFDVASHEVTYDGTRQIWTADVAVDATFSYRPFVQLHLCRYQPVAIDGQHASVTVPADPIRLGARRVVTVSPLLGGEVRVRLTGPDAVNSVRVVLQWHEGGTVADDAEFGWLDEREVLASRTGSTAASTHRATLSTSAPTGNRRLVIEETESTASAVDGVASSVAVVAYREVIVLPPLW
jgi:hypothetical protein